MFVPYSQPDQSTDPGFETIGPGHVFALVFGPISVSNAVTVSASAVTVTLTDIFKMFKFLPLYDLTLP